MRVHKEFGLNPTMSSCIICKEPTGEIALLGASIKEQAPMYSVTSIEPCKKCRTKYLKNGIMLVEAKVEWRGSGKQTVPTGKLIVLKNSAFKRIINQPLPPRQIAMVEVGVIEKLTAQA